MDDMTAPAGDGAGQPSEEELREYLSQLRQAPVQDVVAQVLSVLLNAAQVKLGRNDGRVLIDLVDAVANTARPHVDQRLTAEVDQLLAQLRMAQVEGERELARLRDEGKAAQAEAGDVEGGDAPPGEPAPSSGQEPPGREPPGQQGTSAASRLWVPPGSR